MKKAFTMAEAILVMTILGIVATIMISTMKPAQFKEKGYKILAQTIYGELDTALVQILVDKSPTNKLSQVYDTSGTEFSFATASKGAKVIGLLKVYMATARGTVPTVCTGAKTVPASGTGTALIETAKDNTMLLKNGACLTVATGSTTSQTWIPGEASNTAAAAAPYGLIFMDVNGDDSPNTFGVDQFIIPLDEYGVVGN